MKNTTYVLIIISLILCSPASTAATVRWNLQPSAFFGGDGVFTGSHEGTIKGWFQFDSANPLNTSKYSFIFQTTIVRDIPIKGYTYSSFNHEDGHRTGTIELGDATSFTIIGFVLVQNLQFRFPLTYLDTNAGNTPVFVQEIVGDVYHGLRYANTFATATTVPLSSSNIYFAIGLSVLLFYRRRLNPKANYLTSHYTNAAKG